jgi:transcription termination/antitermination protein NusG
MAIKKENNEELKLDLTPRWYILQTYVGFEDAVRRTIEAKIENSNLGDKLLELYIPLKKVVKLNKKGERTEKTEKIYPGYIYLKMILDKEIAYLIQNTQYVSRIAGTGDFAVALEEGYVERLKEKLAREDENAGKTTLVNYKIGETIRVTDGPFKDMQGKISSIDSESSRVNVLLTIFDRETNVELDILEVQKIV